MKQRTIMIMAAVLGLLVLIILVSQRAERAPGTGASSLLIAALNEQLDAVDNVTVTAAGGVVVATLTRGETGWVVAERSGYPANVTRLRAGLRALAQARRIEQKTANPAFYDRLGVEPVENADANGVLVSIGGLAEQPIEVIIGDAAGNDYRYVRLQNEATSWLVDRDPDFPETTGEWLAADLLDINSDRIQSITITHPDGERLAVSKGSRDQADFSVAEIPAGRELLYKGVANAMGDVLEKLSLEDVEAASGNADELAVVTEYRSFDGLVITASGQDRGDAAWVSFAARFDPEQAAAFAAPAPDGDGAAEQTPATATDTDSAPDVAAQAQQINDKLSGWRYRISQFKFEQLTRRMNDLLQAAPADS